MTLFAGLMLVLLGAQVPAAPETARSDAPAPAVKEKKICKTQDGGTVSRMRKRVCRTEREWEQAESRTDASDLQRMGAK